MPPSQRLRVGDNIRAGGRGAHLKFNCMRLATCYCYTIYIPMIPKVKVNTVHLWPTSIDK